MRSAACRTRRADRSDLIGAWSSTTSTQFCPRTALRLHPTNETSSTMVVVGIDAHKRTHTAVAVDELGKRVASKTVPATSAGNLQLVRWAQGLGEHRFAVEDCRVGPDSGLVLEPCPLPAQPWRQSSGQRRPTPHRSHPAARRSGKGLRRTAYCHGEHKDRSHPGPSSTDLRRGLPATHDRPRCPRSESSDLLCPGRLT